ncbi:MAG: H-X9-DG-CTERM domain-containing protein [Armatimonadota bacterium]|nr:H-X9-DG-CTERM domain-containing protein [Armatimonadota bacterium]
MDPSTRRQWKALTEHVTWWLIPLIIVIIAASAFPYLARQRAEARQQSCLSNLKSIALWTRMYAEDNDHRLPPGQDWVGQLGEHVKNRSVLECPSDPVRHRVSYGFNRDLFGADVEPLDRPRSRVLYHDGRAGVVVERHDGGANYSFADGHAEWRAHPPESLNATVAEEGG